MHNPQDPEAAETAQTKNAPNCLEAQECRGDFWIMMREAVIQCGGCPSILKRYADKPLRDVVELLAPNGIRMVYIPAAHIEAISQANTEPILHPRLVVPLRIPPLRSAEPRPETACECPKCNGSRMQIYQRGRREYPSPCNKCFGRGWIINPKLPVKFA